MIMYMTAEALDQFRNSSGWEAGANAQVAMIDEGKAADIGVIVAESPVIAFVFGQKGLMGDLSVEGSKITKLERSAVAEGGELTWQAPDLEAPRSIHKPTGLDFRLIPVGHARTRGCHPRDTGQGRPRWQTFLSCAMLSSGSRACGDDRTKCVERSPKTKQTRGRAFSMS